MENMYNDFEEVMNAEMQVSRICNPEEDPEGFAIIKSLCGGDLSNVKEITRIY